MAAKGFAFDHIHLVSQDPEAAAAWYAANLGAEVAGRKEVGGAPQIYLRCGGTTLILRGRRTGEEPDPRPGLAWGADHFGFRLEEDLDAFCARLKARGVVFDVEPRVSISDPGLRIAYVRGPDGVSIELLRYGS